VPRQVLEKEGWENIIAASLGGGGSAAKRGNLNLKRRDEILDEVQLQRGDCAREILPKRFTGEAEKPSLGEQEVPGFRRTRSVPRGIGRK